MKSLVLFMLALMVSASACAASADMTRGEYLTRLSDCRACHTQPGRAPFAGGLPIKTPFGVVYTPNITPDPKTGIGNWSFKDFYRAMHLGVDKSGHYLYPVFPFTAYTNLTRSDVKAIWHYMKTIKPVRQKNKPNALDWPYNMRGLMSLWRWKYFKPGTFKPDPKKSHLVNRGAYIVKGLAHCGACHTPRNRLGSLKRKYALAGGSIPVEGWYPPNITSNDYIGVGDWSADQLKSFLKTGFSSKSAALGPMRDLIQTSLQYLTGNDLRAVVAYLQQTMPIGPRHAIQYPKSVQVADETLPGQALYHKHCAGCHGDKGYARHHYYPNLKNNPVVLEHNPNNLLLIMLRGGFEAATKARPYPHSMPPFGFKLSDQQIALIANYVRRNWSQRKVPRILPKQVDSLR